MVGSASILLHLELKLEEYKNVMLLEDDKNRNKVTYTYIFYYKAMIFINVDL